VNSPAKPNSPSSKQNTNRYAASVSTGAASTGGLAALAVNKEQEMNRVTHFEIYTDDPEAVQPFYQDVFGWKFNKFEGGPIEYWLVTTGDDKEPGINGGITRPREGQSSGTLNTIAVESLDRTIKEIEQAGGKICVPKMAIPKIGWLAYAADPAGNVFGIIEPDANAK
jgi:predicted enzyme related to lactoylglutathione lyase